MNEEQKINLYIENKGEIVAYFKLKKPSSSSSNKISFDLEEGKLEVSQRINFFMTFKSNKIGQFIETFQWQLKGSSTKLNLTVKGHVKAPKFEFDHQFLDFGKVSFQFEEVRKLTLTNISNVPFNFSLRIPQDGRGSNKEFEIVPLKNTILPNEVKTIIIKVGEYVFFGNFGGFCVFFNTFWRRKRTFWSPPLVHSASYDPYITLYSQPHSP